MSKYNKYSNELRLEIVNKYYNNEGSSRSLGKEYNISYKTNRNIW
jgi:transposase-like protein